MKASVFYSTESPTSWFIQSLGFIPSYFDYEKYGRDLAMDLSEHNNHYFTP